ncbi:MAG TPA: hypothetical protein VF433_00435, partial [Cellvibrio sp.]
MPAIPALISAGGTLLASKQQSDAAGAAANTQAKGVAAAQQMQRDFTNRALNYLQPSFQNARTALQQGQIQGGLLLDEAGNVLSRGYDQARGDVGAGFMGAEQLYQPAYQQGQASAYKQAALNGLLGPDAQRQAYAEFQSSPGTEWLQNRQEQAILRNAAALGGGLANQTGVQQELQQNALGGALQDYGNYYNRLSGFTDRGDAATGAISGIRQNLGQILANLSTSKAGDIAGIYGQQANLATGTQQGLSQLFANEGITAGNVLVGAGSEQSQLAQNLGVAQSGGQLYAAQNSPAWAQALQQGLGT